MKAGFYEFEFTVAFIHDFLKRSESRGSHAIVGMPPPVEEARVGYDAKLATDGYTRFFQFKRPDYIGAGRGKQGRYYRKQPYYRINITPHERSPQHNLLVNLARRDHEVYYVAPIFHDVQQLDLHRSAEQIMEQSIWVPAKDLRIQQRGDRSCITYLPDGDFIVHPGETRNPRSEPRYEYPEVTAGGRHRIDRERYAGLLNDLMEIVGQETGEELDDRQVDVRSMAVQETERRHVGMGYSDVPEPSAYRVTDADRVRYLLHSKFRLKAITVSNPRS